MTNDAVKEGCFEKLDNAIIMLDKAASDLKLLKSQVDKNQLSLAAAMTTACSVLTNAMYEISISDLMKLAACAAQLDGWGA